MKINIKTILTGADDNSKLGNGFTFTSEMEGNADADFKVNNIQKFVFELVEGNSFDKKLFADILNGIEKSDITGVWVHCYDTTVTDEERLPIKFALSYFDGTDTAVLMRVSQFCLGDLEQWAADMDFVFNAIVVAADKTVNFVVIVTTKNL